MPKMNHVSKVSLVYTKPGDSTRTKTLTFQIVDNPVTRAWLNIVEKQQSHPRYEKPIYSIKSTVNSSFDVHNKALCEHIKYINANYADMGFSLPEWEPTLTGDSAEKLEKLNRLHEEFHIQEDRQEREFSQGEKIRDKFETNREKHIFIRSLAKLNAYIHQLEDRIRGDGNEHSPSYGVIILGGIPFEQYQKENIPIQDEWRPHFTRDPQLNDCYLSMSYSTIGKDLWTCWRNNDIDIVKKGLVSPKLDLSADFIINKGGGRFSPQPNPDVNFTHQMNETYLMIKWLVDNDLMQYIDITDKKHFYPSNCIYGFLEGGISHKEFDSLLDDWEMSEMIVDRKKI